MGNHVIFCTYIRTERVRTFVIISLILSAFSYGKAQIPHRFCNKPLSKRYFHARCSFPHYLEQRQNVFARGCVENYSALHKTFQYSFVAYKDKVYALHRMKILLVLRKQWTIFSPVLSEYKFKITKIGHVILRLAYETDKTIRRWSNFSHTIYLVYANF